MVKTVKNAAYKFNTHKNYFRGRAIGTLGFCTSWAIDHTHKNEREWLETVKTDLLIDNLPQAFEGTKIVHVSDLHCSTTVSQSYLEHCVSRINTLEADIICLTGDFVTHDLSGKFRKKIAQILSELKSKSGNFACLGNHDYGIGSVLGSIHKEHLNTLVDQMYSSGINLLRNESGLIKKDGQRLRIIGLGDLWAGDLDQDRAYRDLCSQETVITLAHNPETVKKIPDLKADAVLAGHTHGVKVSFKPSSRGVKMYKRDYHAGLYDLGDKQMYVTRGLGRLGRMFCNPRPEITQLTLKRA